MQCIIHGLPAHGAGGADTQFNSVSQCCLDGREYDATKKISVSLSLCLCLCLCLSVCVCVCPSTNTLTAAAIVVEAHAIGHHHTNTDCTSSEKIFLPHDPEDMHQLRPHSPPATPSCLCQIRPLASELARVHRRRRPTLNTCTNESGLPRPRSMNGLAPGPLERDHDPGLLSVSNVL